MDEYYDIVENENKKDSYITDSFEFRVKPNEILGFEILLRFVTPTIALIGLWRFKYKFYGIFCKSKYRFPKEKIRVN